MTLSRLEFLSIFEAAFGDPLRQHSFCHLAIQAVRSPNFRYFLAQFSDALSDRLLHAHRVTVTNTNYLRSEAALYRRVILTLLMISKLLIETYKRGAVACKEKTRFNANVRR